MDFKYSTEIIADPEEVFAALTNEFQIEIWSGYPATMKAEKDFEFSLWEGDICGKILDFKENVFIKQEWYFGDVETKSIATINLKKDKDKTIVELFHTNIPDDVYEEITEGWREYYLGAIKDMLEIY